MLRQDLVDDFHKMRSALQEALSGLEDRLKASLSGAHLQIHSVSGRVKEVASFQFKVSRPDKSYAAVTDVTDVIGLRVVTYFEDTIDEVAALIEQKFRVDYDHSINKLQFADHERFGYRSLHYVCFLPEDLIGVYSQLSNVRFEIQIRTVLQDAWAEIEHDLGYKASDLAPAQLRRRFSRVASLLEIADEEFVSIRRELTQYKHNMGLFESRETPSIDDSPVALDRVSMDSLLKRKEVVELDRKIADILQLPLGESAFYPDYLLKMLRIAGIRDTGSAQRALLHHQSEVLNLVLPYFEFAKSAWGLTPDSLRVVPRGYSLFFLAYLVTLESEALLINKIRKVALLFEELDYPGENVKSTELAKELLNYLS